MRLARMLLATAAILAVATAASGSGLSINVPLVGRLVGAGNTAYVTSVDVTNNAATPVNVDFYFVASSNATADTVSINGSVSDFGVTARQTGAMSGLSNQHFDDFVDALVQSGLLSASFRDGGVIGSVLFVFNGYSRSGQAAVSARFYNALSGGYVGVALRGHEIAQNEPQKLVAAVRDTRANPNAAQIYSNLFINNTGLTPSGIYTADPATVHLTAVSARTGQPVGQAADLTVGSGLTANVSPYQALGVSNATDDTILVFATVTSGSAAIEGVVSLIDPVTKDGSAFEMTRADF